MLGQDRNVVAGHVRVPGLGDEAACPETAKRTDALLISGIDANSIFLADRSQRELAELADAAWRMRQRGFLATGLRLSATWPELARNCGFDTAFGRFKAMRATERRTLCEHPAFRAWLPLAGRDITSCELNGQTALMRRRMEQFVSMRDSFTGEDHDRILLRRFDVEAPLAEAAPPSFDFHEGPKRLRNASAAYTLAFFRDVLNCALSRIDQVWSGARNTLQTYVKMVIHLPGADFRSCSAQRFAGAVMLTSVDDTLLAVEESLVHEFGHQVLYALMEIEPLVRADPKRQYVLPWSGSLRDGYGYFHATYIYLLLALYFEAARDRVGDPTGEASIRLADILGGLQAALLDFEGADFFTPTGQAFFFRLRKISRQLLDRNRRPAHTAIVGGLQ